MSAVARWVFGRDTGDLRRWIGAETGVICRDSLHFDWIPANLLKIKRIQLD